MRGKPLRPMQGEVSPSDPLLRLSGAVQPTAAIMRHAKQWLRASMPFTLRASLRLLKWLLPFSLPRIDYIKHLSRCIAPGQGFALKAAESLGWLAPHKCRVHSDATRLFKTNTSKNWKAASRHGFYAPAGRRFESFCAGTYRHGCRASE